MRIVDHEPGAVCLRSLCQLRDGRHMEPALRDWFKSIGARIDRRKVYLTVPFEQ